MAYTFLTIEGITVNVLVGSGAEDPPEIKGRRRRAFAGNFRSTQRTPKLAFSGQADFWTAADLDLVLAATCASTDPAGTIPRLVTVASDPDGLTRGRTISAYVTFGKREALVQQAGGLESTFWTAPFTIEQA